MFSLYSKKYNYIMHCVPKAGCTYLRTLFLQLHKDEAKNSSITNIDASLLADDLSSDQVSGIPSILILRNPYDRLVSAWVDKVALKPTVDVEEFLIPKFKKFLGEKDFLNSTLEDFCNFLLSESEYGEIDHLDQHVAPQVPSAWQHKPKVVADLAKVNEVLKNFYSKIDSNLSIKYATYLDQKPNRQNVSEFTQETDYLLKQFPAAQLTVDEVHALAQMKMLPPRSWFFSKSVIDSIRRVYKRDLSFLRFSQPKSVPSSKSIFELRKYINAAWKQRHKILHRGDLPDDFCEICYNNLNPDIVAAQVNATVHYRIAGVFESYRQYKQQLPSSNLCEHKSFAGYRKSASYGIYKLQLDTKGYYFESDNAQDKIFIKQDGKPVLSANGWIAETIHVIGDGSLSVLKWKHDSLRTAIWLLDANYNLVSNKSILADPNFKDSKIYNLWNSYLRSISKRVWAAFTTTEMYDLDSEFIPSNVFVSDDVQSDLVFISKKVLAPCNFIEISDAQSLKDSNAGHGLDVHVNYIRKSLTLLSANGEWQDEAILNEFIEITCPFTGGVISTNQSILFTEDGFSTAYRFQSKNEIFFLITTLHQNIKFGLYFPERNVFYYTGVSHIGQNHLNDFFINILKSWSSIKPYLLHTSSKRSVGACRESHLGHHLWNELTGIDRLRKSNSLESLHKLYVNQGDGEHYGTIEQLFPSLVGRVERIELRTLSRLVYDNYFFFVKPGSSYISEALCQSITQFSLDQLSKKLNVSNELIEFKKDESSIVIIFTLRLDNRSWVGQEDGICQIILKLAENTKKSIFLVLDGHNKSPDGFKLKSHGEHTIKAQKGLDLFEEEYGMAKRIQTKLNSKRISVVNTVGCTVAESICWSINSDFFIAPWGAGMAKYKWIVNKPGIVFSTKKVLEEKPDLHIYDDKTYRENATPCIYIKPTAVSDCDEKSILTNSDAQFRDNFQIDVDALYELVLNLCKKLGRSS